MDFLEEQYISRDYLETPIGFLEITVWENEVAAIHFVDRAGERQHPENPVLQQAIQQLEEYFRQKRRQFALPLLLHGTEFQKKVWKELLRIPYGVTRSYAQIARALGNPRAIRAVGMANRANPLAIVVPCHRVIGSKGKLVGYAGGVWRKEWLLKHEGIMLG